eukprot:UN08073
MMNDNTTLTLHAKLNCIHAHAIHMSLIRARLLKENSQKATHQFPSQYVLLPSERHSTNLLLVNVILDQCNLNELRA